METIFCPHCQAQLQVEAEWNGLEVACPTCNQAITVSIPSTGPQGTPLTVSPNTNIQQSNRIKRKNHLQQHLPNYNLPEQNAGYNPPPANMNVPNAGYPSEPGFRDVAQRKINNLMSAMVENQCKTHEYSVLFSVISWFFAMNGHLLIKYMPRQIGAIIFLIVLPAVFASVGLFSAIVSKFNYGIYIASAFLATAVLRLIPLF